ncbi:hypothetical protein JTB14_028208 [Gonioctena quinquepunctata]|nr:hypothetical protein JTB14_028208 [Gonioctena quinquepunctata]
MPAKGFKLPPGEQNIPGYVEIRQAGADTQGRATKRLRTICLLRSIGKLYELMLRRRLEVAIEEGNGISAHQYGFRKSKSAIEAVLEADEGC